MNINLIVLVLIILGFFDLAFIIVFLIYRRKFHFLFSGKKGGDLGDLIGQIDEQVKLNAYEIESLKKYADELNLRLKKAVQAVGLIRFKAFNDVGGDQSFSLAALDENLNGVVISSIYSREGVRVYSKAIENGASKYNLSGEEVEAVKIASRQLQK